MSGEKNFKYPIGDALKSGIFNIIFKCLYIFKCANLKPIIRDVFDGTMPA